MHYQALWSQSLWWISGVVTVLMVGISALSGWVLPLEATAITVVASGFPLLILAIALLFTVRGYELRHDGLRVQRLMWSTDVPLQGLRRAWRDPKAMSRALRLFGNGGMYSFTGLFRNKKLGYFRAYVTDPANSVVLELAKSRVVVSPDSPDTFLRQISSLWPDIEMELGNN